MGDIAAMNIFQFDTVPKLLRKILDEQSEARPALVTDGTDTDHLAISVEGCRPFEIPRAWEVTSGSCQTLKNWLESKVLAVLAASRHPTARA